MKKRNNSAFTLLEVVFAIAIFAAAIPNLINAFLSIMRTPSVNKTAVSMIADIDNCMTNIDKIKNGNAQPSKKKGKDDQPIYCLLSDSRYSAAKKVSDLSNKEINNRKTLKLYELSIWGYPNHTGSVTAYSYRFE